MPRFTELDEEFVCPYRHGCPYLEGLPASWVWERHQRVVGLENNTSFIRAVRSGKLHAKATPVTRGRTTQVWEAWIKNEQEQLVAQGRVRLRIQINK